VGKWRAGRFFPPLADCISSYNCCDAYSYRRAVTSRPQPGARTPVGGHRGYLKAAATSPDIASGRGTPPRSVKVARGREIELSVASPGQVPLLVEVFVGALAWSQ
jgi:hypothetical protein